MNRRTLIPLSVAWATLILCQSLLAQEVMARKMMLREKIGYIQPQNTTPTLAVADDQLLRNAGLPTDGAGLLKFFKQRSEGKATPEKLAALITQLGDKNAATRNKACAELIGYGPVSIPMLRQAAKDLDAAESSALAKRCLELLEHNSAQVSAAALRELIKSKPAGAVEALLIFLPDAEDQTVLDEVKNTLNVLAVHDGKIDPALLKALEDPLSLRRATAIEVICQNGHAEPRATLRKLLADTSPTVRLRAGLALAQAREAKAVSTLISLLADLHPTQARQVEEFLIGLAEDQAPKVALGEDEAGRIKCRDAWAAWWISTEGAKLLDELKKRTLTEEVRDKIVKLIEKLGDDAFDVRQDATKQLKALGSLTIPMLKAATSNPDLEVRQRAQTCLAEIEKDTTVPLSPVVPKLVALRKPAGAVEALLNYMPSAPDEGIASEVQVALNAVAYTDGKPSPTLLKALEDKLPARRAAAAEALCGQDIAEHLPALRKLLKDPEVTVKLKVAMAMACARQKEAVPVLIASLSEAPAEQAAVAEEYLYRVAGDNAPKNMPAGDGDARTKRRDLWAKWWEDNGTKVALLDRSSLNQISRFLGYTLLVQAQNGMVSELGSDGKQRWQITGLLGPQDAQVLPGDRVLISEYNGQRVTERNLKGEIVWQKAVGNWPMMAQRLRNGNTFIVTRNQLMEVDRNGKDVHTINRPFNDVMSAHKLRDGNIVIVSNQQNVIWMDATGKELRTFRIQGVSNFGNEVLPNGHVLVPISWQNRVLEYDKEGKVVWEKTVNQPMSAFRLPNGHTLVATQQWPAKVVELDKEGKQVAEIATTNYVIRAKRR